MIPNPMQGQPQQPQQRAPMPMPTMQPPKPPQMDPAIGDSIREAINKMSSLPTPALMQLTKDPGVGYLAATEIRMRNQKRMRQQPMPPQPQGTVVDKEVQQAMQAENMGIMSGIPQMPQGQPQGFSRGGIVAFAGGGEPSEMELRAEAHKLAMMKGISEDAALALVKQVRMREEGRYANTVLDKIIDPIKELFRDKTAEERGGDPNARTMPWTRYQPPASSAYPAPTANTEAYWDRVNDPRTVPPTNTGTPPLTVDPTIGPPAPTTLPPSPRTRPAGIASLTAPPAPAPQSSTLPKVDYDPMEERRQLADLVKQQEGLVQKDRTPEEWAALRQQAVAAANKLNPMDPEYASQMQRIKDKLAQLEGNEPRNRRQGFIEAGLSMMSQPGRSFLGNVGAGGLAGTKVYRDLQAGDERRMDTLDNSLMDAIKGRMTHQGANVRLGLDSLTAEEAYGQKTREQQAAIIAAKMGLAKLPGEQAKNISELAYRDSATDFNRARTASEPEDVRTRRMLAEAALKKAAVDVAAGIDWRTERDYNRALTDITKGIEARDKANIIQRLRLQAIRDKMKLSPEQLSSLADAEINKRALTIMRDRNAPGTPMHELAKSSLKMYAIAGDAPAAPAPNSFSAPAPGTLREGKL